MNRITQMLTMTGLGVFAAVSVGAGPAMAATGSTQSPVKPTSPTAPSRTRIVDIYPSGSSCSFAGELGERRGDWDDYDCYRTGGGYALQISFDSWGDWNNWDDNDWDGPWGLHHGHGGGGFRDHGGRGHGFRDHDGRDRGGRDRGGRDRGGRDRGNRPRGDNGVGATVNNNPPHF